MVARVMKRSPEDQYADAYRRGYERARRSFEPTARLDREAMKAPGPSGLRPRAARAVMTSRLGSGGPGSRRFLTGAGLGLAAVALVGGAFGVGRIVGHDSSMASAGAEGPASPSDSAPYAAAVRAVAVAGSTATCQSGASVDAAGNPVTYEPSLAHDSDLSTAWRCDGAGVGERLTVELPEAVEVAELGIVPGYAKTDPANGVDRYAENNRITRVRWRLDDGSTFVQRMSPDPSDRSMRTLRIPATETRSVVLEILRSQQGPRNTVAISEVRVAAPAATS
jgi:hypothetical protein